MPKQHKTVPLGRLRGFKPASPKPPEFKPNFKLYVTIGGVYIAGREHRRNEGEIYAYDLARVTMNQNGIDVSFAPFTMLDQPVLYESALLMEDAMPPSMIPYYAKYQQTMEAARAARPKQK